VLVGDVAGDEAGPVRRLVEQQGREKWSSFSCGACHWAKGIAPESNQTSITSGTRRSGSPPVGDGISISSTNGRCGSPMRVPLSCSSSSNEPTQTVSPASLRHTGSGVPQ
jgi:hypothetical protein